MQIASSCWLQALCCHLWLITSIINSIGGSHIGDGCDAVAQVYRITVGDSKSQPLQCHVPEGVDIAFQCMRSSAHWYYENALLQSGSILRLSRAQANQGGNYACRYGEESWANVTLRIGDPQTEGDDIASFDKMESSAELLQHTADSKTLYFKPLNNSANCFKFTEELPLHMERTAGGSLKLSCAASGNPTNITWQHNRELLNAARSEHYKLQKWTLTVLRLAPTDAGLYTCVVCKANCCREQSTSVQIATRARSPPKLSDESMPTNVSVALGDNASFQCPLEESLLEPYVQWWHSKDKPNLVEWEAQQLVEKLVTSEDEPQVLHLENVQQENEGWYTCVAANSLGRTLASAYLEVTAASTATAASTTTERSLDAEADVNDADAVNKTDAEESAPRFKKPESLRRLQHYPSGSTLVLACPVHGNPEPNITWTRNGQPIERHMGKVVYKKWSLRMDDLIMEDSGTYICKMCNRLGCIQFSYNVNAIDRIRHRPIISDKFPQNQTALVNTTAILECRVVSDTEPAISWVRVMRHNHSVAYKAEESAESGLQVVKLKSDPDQPHILQLPNVTHAQEGWYTCVASNSLGEAKTSAYLRVVDRLPHAEIYALLRSHPIGITVAAIVVVALFLLGSAFIVYMMRRLRREKLLKHRIETVHQWTKKVIIYRPPSVEGNSCGAGDLQMPVIKIEKQRTTFSTTSANADPAQAFNEYEFPLDSNWEIPRQQLCLGSILGEGAFGRVVMAQADGLPRNASGTIVAVKMVKEEHTDADMASLVREMEVMKMIGKHINIINLLGCCSQGGPLWVIVEFAPHGNLKDFLKQHRPGGTQRRSESDGYLDDKALQMQLGEKELTMFAFQIARGMEYLASRRCIHRDLAARNVLVSDGYVMKIADFGLARDIQDTDYYRKNTNGRLPIKWMAPESLQEKFYDSQSDVWSYGVLLWEIMTYGEQPYPHIMSAEELYSYLITGQRMEKPTRCSLNIYIVMRQCWHFDACARPTFAELVESLDGILQQASSNPNDAYLDLSMPMLETPPTSSDEDDDGSETEAFRETLPHRYQYTYKFN